MRVKMLTFRYSATLGGFDDTALSELARDKELIAVREHFYLVNEVPHLTCVVHYQDAVVPQATLQAARAMAHEAAQPAAPFSGPPRWANDGRRAHGADRPDPAAGLSEQDRVLFNSLREWRSEQCRKEGVPAYVLFTNRHFLELVANRPDSLTALGHLDGFGPAKVEKHGKALLALLHGANRTGIEGVGAAPKTVDNAAPTAAGAGSPEAPQEGAA